MIFPVAYNKLFLSTPLTAYVKEKKHLLVGTQTSLRISNIFFSCFADHPYIDSLFPINIKNELILFLQV